MQQFLVRLSHHLMEILVSTETMYSVKKLLDSLDQAEHLGMAAADRLDFFSSRAVSP